MIKILSASMFYSPVTYRVCIINVFQIDGRFRPIIQNFRGTEPLKIHELFESKEAAIAAAKTAIDDWFSVKKGVV